MNINILTQILMSDYAYWLIGTKSSEPGNVMIIAIPQGIERGLKREDIKLSHLEKLESVNLDQNIYLSGNYAPFQLGQTLHRVTQAFPILGNVKKFMINAFNSDCKTIWEYQKLIDHPELTKPEQ